MPVALITGAGSGIGAETALRLARDGYEIILMGRRHKALATTGSRITSQGGRARLVQTDVADGGSVRDGISSVGELDVVVNNAGIVGPIAPLANADETHWREAVLVNLFGPFHVARAAMPLLIASGRGTLINISSGAATRPIPGWSAYCASKAGLSMLTLSIAMEYGAAGVRAFDLRPGPVDTPMRDAIRTMDPSRRTENRHELTAASAVAQAVSWLCTTDADRLVGRQIRLEDIPAAAIPGAADT